MTGSPLACESMLSRVLILSKAVELRSLRRAAVSGSGQSARLTNSYLASSTLSFGWEVVKRRLASAGPDVGLSSDSLKSCRESATFRAVWRSRGAWMCLRGVSGTGRGEEGAVASADGGGDGGK